jgi:hypothetical protein
MERDIPNHLDEPADNESCENKETHGQVVEEESNKYLLVGKSPYDGRTRNFFLVLGTDNIFSASCCGFHHDSTTPCNCEDMYTIKKVKMCSTIECLHAVLIVDVVREYSIDMTGKIVSTSQPQGKIKCGKCKGWGYYY